MVVYSVEQLDLKMVDEMADLMADLRGRQLDAHLVGQLAELKAGKKDDL